MKKKKAVQDDTPRQGLREELQAFRQGKNKGAGEGRWSSGAVQSDGGLEEGEAELSEVTRPVQAQRLQ